MSTTPKLLIAMIALSCLSSLSACNTARGFGQDVQALGRAVSGTAEEVEEDVSDEPDTPAQATTPPTPEPAPR